MLYESLMMEYMYDIPGKYTAGVLVLTIILFTSIIIIFRKKYALLIYLNFFSSDY